MAKKTCKWARICELQVALKLLTFSELGFAVVISPFFSTLFWDPGNLQEERAMNGGIAPSTPPKLK